METIEISKDELERVYREKGGAEAAKHFGISPSNLYRLLDRAGIEKNIPAGDRKPRRRLKLVD